MIIQGVIKNIGLLVILNLLIKPTWLLMEFLVQDRISHEQYGLYAALFSLSFLFVNFADFGINLFITKKLASEPESLRKVFANTIAFKLLMCVLYPVLITSLGYLLGYRDQEIWYLLMLGFVQSFLQTIYFFRANLQSKQFFKIDAFASVFDRILLIVIIGAMLVLNVVSLDNFIYGILITSLFTFLVFYFVIIRLYGWIAPKINVTELQEILKSSFPFALVGILYAVNERMDMVMLERLGGVEGDKFAGWYAAAYRWLDAFMMYLWTVLPVFFARFSFFHRKPEEQQKLLNVGQVIVFIPMLFVCTVIFFYAEKLFLLFENSSLNEINHMADLLRVLVFHGLIQGAFAIYGTYLNASGFEKNVSRMVVFSILINFLLNLFLIPVYGAIAAAYATLLSSLMVSVLYIIFIVRKKILQIPVSILLRLLLTAVLFFTIFCTLAFSALHWLLVVVISGILLLLITYIVYRKSIYYFIKTGIH